MVGIGAVDYDILRMISGMVYTREEPLEPDDFASKWEDVRDDIIELDDFEEAE